MKKILYASMALMVFVFASCSKEEAKENTTCIAQCVLAEKHSKKINKYYNEEQAIQINKLDQLLEKMERQDSLLTSLRAELAATTNQQDTTMSYSDSVIQDIPAEAPSIHSETQVAEPMPEPTPIAEENDEEDRILEIQEKKSSFKEKLLAGGIGAAAGVAGGFMAAQKMNCKRLDVLIEYKLMQACINNCGYSSERKCSEAIMNYLCKEKLEENEVTQRVRSCDI